MEEYIGRYTIACSFKSVSDNFLWAFAGVYGPNLDNNRVCLWEKLAGIHSWWNLPWWIGGDFNVIRFPSESSSSRRGQSAMVELFKCISDLNLVDLALVGGFATWANNHSWSQLDRFLISPEWKSHFPDVWQKRLPSINSDHLPILLDCSGIRGGRRYFKFENMWLKSEGFVERVRQWWSSYQLQGTPSFVLAGKLKALKRDLKLWNMQSFGDLRENKKGKLKEILDIERIQEARPLNQDEVERKTLLGEELERIILLEEISWRQKSRALWLR
ncbi:uncharacterized protein LOC121257839 [Juglans microcarpa x Juglans regia]|uniref:uncharacterized protein LOC121257839 n=1 Tax=Juglans microcarpa x Juglans regia TaxID=2249226 RepID=UPI001B7EA87A|nr:uncharacterized protein LOC121257839 [Juglans microcarpa x Juglans regia]